MIALVDGSGTKVVEYTYDAWGRPTGKTGTLAATLGTVQPFRYRRYVYDEDTGLYYLRSRYYRCEWCRFLNAPGRRTTGSSRTNNSRLAASRGPAGRACTMGEGG